MPNIPSTLRGIKEGFQNAQQSQNPMETIKTGFLGENAEFDIGDLATPLKNIGKGFATAGTGGAFLGALQTLADYFRSPQGIPKTGETSVFDFANTFSVPTDSGLQMPMMDQQVNNMFQTQRQTPDFYRPPIQKTGETSVQDFTNVFTPPTIVRAPVVGEVEGVGISKWTFTPGVISICVSPVAKPPAANIILFSVPLSPVANTRLPCPPPLKVTLPTGDTAAEVTFAFVFFY